MASFRQAIDSLLHVIIQIGTLLMAAIVAIEAWLRHALAQTGLPLGAQTVLMLVAAALLILASLRLFGGLIRIAVVLVLVLIAIHLIVPALPA